MALILASVLERIVEIKIQIAEQDEVVVVSAFELLRARVEPIEEGLELGAALSVLLSLVTVEEVGSDRKKLERLGWPERLDPEGAAVGRADEGKKMRQFKRWFFRFGWLLVDLPRSEALEVPGVGLLFRFELPYLCLS